MINIGIIGSDNSHAMAFSKLVNISNQISGEYEFPDIRISHIYGLDRKQTEEVSVEGQIANIVDAPEDLLAKVDAVMVLFRHGDLHASYALPFLRAGIPVWIDKPFTIKIDDARMLVETAGQHNTLLMGGSTCKYAYDVLLLKNAVESMAMTGHIISGALNFPADLDSEYGGIFFYGAHMVEMLMTIFGYDVKSVSTSVNNGSVVAIAKYDRYQIIMNFTRKSHRYIGIIYGEKENIVREIDISIIYRLGFIKFIEMLKSGKAPLSHEQLVSPVILLNGIDKSIKENREVFLDEFYGDAGVSGSSR
jgi:predicted dehydrogenase